VGIADRDYMREKKLRWDERSGEMRLDPDEGAPRDGSGSIWRGVLVLLVLIGAGGAAAWWYLRSPAQAPAVTDTAQPGSACTIKGNIGASGKVYHMPGSTWYDRTKIDPSQGERWFCTEQEALAAGWRPAPSR
jgi:hypothetical protein